MNRSRQWPQILMFAMTMLVALPAVSRAQVKVLMSAGFSAAYQELLPEFEKTTGITVTTARGASQGDGPTTIGAQLRRGVPADVVIMSRGGLAELIAEGRIVAGSDVDLARVPLAVCVRAGNPKPDISTVESFKQALLHAKSVGTQSSSTIYVTTKLFPQLGIASAMAGKLSDAGPVSAASGAVEMVIAPVSEILSVQGLDFVGTIPEEIQLVQTFAAAVLKGTKEPEASKHLIAFLASEKATPAVEKTGMKRPASARPIDKATNNVFPGKMWVEVSPEELGWSASGLQEARKYFDTLPPANLIVVDRGKVAVEWGDPATRIMVSSMRISVLSVLYGIDLPSSKLEGEEPRPDRSRKQVNGTFGVFA
jgi:molybdate transport system substrate-binding protein